MSRPGLSRLRALTLASLVVLGLPGVVMLPARARAQATSPEHEEAGHSRGGYAWGQAPVDETTGAARPAGEHRFGDLFLSLGVGGTIRMLAYADVCNPDDRPECRFSPPYLQLRAGWFFESDESFQHGVGLGIATNIAPDGTNLEGLDPLGQWQLAPAYHFRYWFDSWFQLMAHVGVPFVFTGINGMAATESFAFNWGLEVQLGLVFKFLQGLGLYASANVTTYFAGQDAVWPTLSFEGGLVFDYEVLP